MRAGFGVAVLAAIAVRAWNAFEGPLMYGYDAWGHVAYALFLDLYAALPWADQGWSYFHPPLHYAIGWPLAKLGSSEVLLRGLAVWGGAASLVVAWLAGWLTHLAAPGRPGLALAAFCAVAFLPVHLYASPMSGNELTAALFSAAAVAFLVVNERRTPPTLRGDGATGVLVALALLSKMSGALALATAAVVLLRVRPEAAAPSRGARLAVLFAVVIAVAGPWYARNAIEFGTPLRLSRADPLVEQIEREQPPGQRGWRDFVAVSPRLFVDPDPRAAHLLHSVWGTLYTNVWVDTRSVWTRASAQTRARVRRAAGVMTILGLVPTALALSGAFLAARDVRRGRRIPVYLPLCTYASFTLVSFVGFAVAVPTFAALKASYLLGASLGYGVFLARGIEGAARRSTRLSTVAATGLAAACLWGATVATAGLVTPRLPENALLGPVRLYFGEDEQARTLYRRLLLGEREQRDIWTENLAAVELVAGDSARAQAIAERRHKPEGDDAWSANQLGVTLALNGDFDGAQELFDLALERGAGAVALANRGAARAARGKADAAEADLREALALDPHLAPAWHALAQVAKDEPAVEAARRAAERSRRRAPRGHVFGLGGGLGQRADPRIGRRWLLWLDGATLRLAHAPARSGW